MVNGSIWQKPNVWNVGWLALLLGFQLQRAHAQIAYYTWMLIGAYSLLVLINGFRFVEERANLRKGLAFLYLPVYWELVYLS